MERITVLVTDDDLSLSRLLKVNLERGEFRVLEATNGWDCISMVKCESVNMLFLDVRLPDLNGWGILGLLRSAESLRHIPVIMASGDPPDTDLMQLLKPEGYMQKPFDMRDLMNKVRSLVELGPRAGEGPRDVHGVRGIERRTG